MSDSVVPDDIKAKFKSGEFGKTLNLEQKLDLRERQKAKRLFEEDQERRFEEETGIKNRSKDMTMDNLVKKYEYAIFTVMLSRQDMAKFDKKEAIKRELDKKGEAYNEEDI